MNSIKLIYDCYLHAWYVAVTLYLQCGNKCENFIKLIECNIWLWDAEWLLFVCYTAFSFDDGCHGKWPGVAVARQNTALETA